MALIKSQTETDRRCFVCDVVEDEHHAIFLCPSFMLIRQNYETLLEKYPSVTMFLNPDAEDVYDVARFLSDIDDVLSKR